MENAENINKVFKESSMFVPTFGCTNRTEDCD